MTENEMAESFDIDVVVYKSELKWIAQGLQYDITVQADSPTELPKKFMIAAMSEVVTAKEYGEEPFRNIPQAPKSFWKMYRSATLTLTEVEQPAMRVDGRAGSMRAPSLTMKMASEAA